MSDTSFSGALDTLKEHLVGYDDGVEQFKLALLTGQHVLLVGRPGRGKSYPGRLFINCVRGAHIFRTQITAYTMPDHLVGAPIPHTYLEEGTAGLQYGQRHPQLRSRHAGRVQRRAGRACPQPEHHSV